ncbi:MAG: hypothetical protein Q4G03_07440 [Planctomycetia bacterium]|nr:hypothetical protein [Planctomycetia bacterium]
MTIFDKQFAYYFTISGDVIRAVKEWKDHARDFAHWYACINKRARHGRSFIPTEKALDRLGRIARDRYEGMSADARVWLAWLVDDTRIFGARIDNARLLGVAIVLLVETVEECGVKGLVRTTIGGYPVRYAAKNVEIMVLVLETLAEFYGPAGQPARDLLEHWLQVDALYYDCYCGL